MSNNLQGTEIAIVAMSGRFPGAANTAEFWQNLAKGVESISFFSSDELRSEGISPELVSDPAYVKARGVVRDADWFDASFFGFAPRQAEVMDPQHRLFMECAWEALEAAGYDPARYEGSIGVYAGTTMSSYLVENLASNRASGGASGGFEAVISNDKDYLATAVSYKLNLKGPSMTVQTSCSTSLVAIHVACQSLLNGECDMALGGGVSIVFPQQTGYLFREGGTRSPDGHCRAFDAQAGGMVSGSGVGVVLLKRLESALEDGDHIRAVIRGSAVNNDGNLKVGFTAPSVDGQSAVISEAQRVAGIDPATISYIEAHGTGTRLGDPCEIRALTQAFRTGTDKKGFCAIGSVKTNVGHLDAASGVTGLIKTVLSLENRCIPASLHFRQPNPEINFENSPFFVNHTLSEWPEGPTPRRAGVSSFGIGGTNAHVVVEEAPTLEPSSSVRPEHLLVLSAKSRSALDRATSNLADHLRANPEASLADVAHTLQLGRGFFPHRRILVCKDRDEAVALLDKPSDRRVSSNKHDGPDPTVVFMFTGQGAQRPNMGLGLYRGEAEFRRHLDDCCDRFRPHLGLDLRELLYPGAGREDEAARRLEQTQLTQPAMFAFEYALAKLWISWGIRPHALIGHSIGEYTAACLSGVFTLEDAVTIVAKRGRLMGEMPAGDMLSVPLPESELKALLGEGLSIAAINGPGLCVVSGPKQAIDELEAALEKRALTTQRLRTSHAFHSSMMEPILQPFAAHMQRVRLQAPTIPFISNLTGDWIQAGEATDPSYWTQHLRQTVRFSQGLERLVVDPDRILLEVGPGTTLRSLASGHPARNERTTVLSSLPPAREQQTDLGHLLRTAGQLWMHGCQPDWPALYAGEQRRRVPLPTYPFERQRYWIPRGTSRPDAKQSSKREITDWLFEPSWKRSSLPKVTPSENSKWLLFIDDSGVGNELSGLLTAQGADAIRVSAGGGFSRTSGQAFTINPGCREDYLRLFAELSKGDGMPARIVHLWSVSDETAYDTTPELFAERQRRGFYSLLFLVQALTEAEVTTPLQLSVVTNQAQDVTGEEPLCPDKATVLSAALTIGTEFPHIRCRSVDVAIPRPQDVRVQAANVLTEASSNATDLVVAWRGNYRWLQSFEPLPLAPTPERPAPLREGGTYLITGGLGGMALAVAEYLARTVRAKLVLVGRTELPAREGWEDIIERVGTADPLARKIRSVQAMERSGAEVLLCRADVSDKQQMSDVLASARARFGAVHGVVHAAGIPGGGVLLRQTPETVERVFAAKVGGALVLDELLRGEALDFFVLCSSQTAFLGQPGRSEYAAANRFLDAYARHRAKAGHGFVTTINWDTWREVGMAVQTKRNDDGTQREVQREFGLSTSQGVEVFSRILNSGATQVLVAIRGVEVASDDPQRAEPSTSASEPDTRPSPSAHPRPDLRTDYEAPRSDAERSLARIWREVLGVEPIGIHDNYYELGGDSVGGIQVVAKANQSGLALSIKHILQYQTIAELATVASGAVRIEAEQGAVTGPVLLTPIQCWFFERGFASPHHFNQSVLLEELQPLDVSLVRQVLTRLHAHHDALRLRYTQDESGWQQIMASPGDEAVVQQVDLGAVSDDEVAAAIEAAATQLQGTLNLSRGPLLMAARFDLGPHRHGRWLMCIHHLAVDNVSWRFLLEDFQALYQGLAGGGTVALPAKTVSFKNWSNRLNEHAQTDAVRQELEYWLAPGEAGIARLPRDFPEGGNTYGSKEVVSATLSPQETQLLLDEARKGWNAQVNELLLTATAQAFAQWSGQASVLLDLEGHGREEFVAGIDVSRTAGWFTTMYPVVLRPGLGARPRAAIKSVKEQLRAIPNNGMNYGLLRYLNVEAQQRLKPLPQSEIVFLYLGAADQTESGSTLLKYTHESRGPGHAPDNERVHLMEVMAGIASDQLTVSLTFSRGVYRRETALSIVTNLVEALRLLIRHRPSAAAGGLTPADFPLADLDQRALEQVIANDSQIEDIYPLSPLQQGLLFHSLYDSGSGGYFEQLSCTLEGDLTIEAFQQAWQRVFDRHPALRTSFRYEHLDKPLQIVHRNVKLPWDVQDWRSLSQAEQEERLASFLLADRRRGLELTEAPLMRVALVRLGEHTFQFVWSHSHLLLDGWSGPLIIREVMNLYDGLSRGEEVELHQPRPFRDYIAWLAAQSPAAAEAYWRDRLGGFTRPTPLGGLPTAGDSHGEGPSHRRRPLPLPVSTTNALRAFARKHHLTLNTVLQAAWALVLGCRAGDEDVVFGVSVSGRPPQLEDVDSIVGLFINTLPLRVRLNRDDALVPWLAGIHAGQAEQREYEYTALVDVHGWSDVPRGTPLFESLLVFKNHPVQKAKSALTVRDVHAEDASHYALTLDVTLRPDILCRVNYDTRRFDHAAISDVLRYLEAAITTLVTADESAARTVGEILDRTQEFHHREQQMQAKSASKKTLAAIARKPVRDRTR